MRKHYKRISKHYSLLKILFCLIRQGFLQLIVKIKIVVSFNILHSLTSIRVAPTSAACVSRLATVKILHYKIVAASVSRHESSNIIISLTLYSITEGIVKERNAIIFSKLIRIRLNSAVSIRQLAHIPAFAKNNRVRVNCMNSFTHFLNGFKVNQSHQIKTEAVNTVLFSPILYRVNNILSHHFAL